MTASVDGYQSVGRKIVAGSRQGRRPKYVIHGELIFSGPVNCYTTRWRSS